MMLSCRKCSADFEVTKEDLAHLAKISPKVGEKVLEIPPPTLCYPCRLQRRFVWRNDMKLYERKCNVSGERLISMFRPDSPMNVVHKDYWWSDKWDPRDYGREFDFTRGFFEQFSELMYKVPVFHIATERPENSLYTNYNMANKNCYLCSAGNFLEDSLYCYNAQESKDCVDCLFVYDCELCYQCVQVNASYNLSYCLNVKNCQDSWFLEDCEGCRDCLLCWNLRRKKFCILNEQYTEEEYRQKLKEYGLNTLVGVEDAKELWEKNRWEHAKRSFHNYSVENCVGEYINESKNCVDCYSVQRGGEDLKYVFNAFPDFKDGMDCTYSGEKVELFYETMASGSNCRMLLFDNLCFSGSSDVYCSQIMKASKNCFACCCMRNAEYCIFNKQYSKDEYEELVPKIVEHMKMRGEWGEFFDPQYSPFGYNETWAQEYFPLNRDEALRANFIWSDYEAPIPQAKKLISKDQELPDISEVPDVVLDWAIACEVSGRPFKIVKKELEFCRKHKLQIPRRHPDIRHSDRLKLRNTWQVYDRKCSKSAVPIKTSYPPDSSAKVYSEGEYLKEVY
jgi:hypothetical protein